MTDVVSGILLGAMLGAVAGIYILKWMFDIKEN